MKYLRFEACPKGGTTNRWLPSRTCTVPRGPLGGVCGCCGNAILNSLEQRAEERARARDK